MKGILRGCGWVIILLFTTNVYSAEIVFYYHTDPAGTPLAMTDSSGNVVWRGDYKPFGEELEITPEPENKLKFVGKEKDKETGLYYFGARYMETKIGRFISPDPVGAVDPHTEKINQKNILNPQRLNYYVYGLNNPNRYTDPDGRVIEVIGTEKEKKIIKSDIQKLKNKSKMGKELMEKFEKSKEVIKIKTTEGGDSYNIDKNTIEYNPNRGYIYSGAENWHNRPPEVGLSHEAIHSYHDITNDLGPTREIEESKTVGLGKHEKEPYSENKIRKDYGIERRPQY